MKAVSAAKSVRAATEDVPLEALVPHPQKLPFNLTQDRLNTELYAAWRKDVREYVTPESQKRFRELMERGLKDREVIMRNAHIGVNVTLALASVLARSAVSKVDFNHNVLQDAGCEAVAHLMREAPHLTHLNLGGNDIGPQGIQVLSATLASHKKLQTLILGSSATDQHVNRVDAASGKLLAEAAMRCKTLKVLDLNRNPLGRGSQEAFPMLAKLVQSSTALQVLKLRQTEMCSESAQGILTAMQRNTSLTELDFSANNLNPRVGEVLGQLLLERSKRPAPSCLRILHLQQNPNMGNRGAVAIFRGLANDKGLTHLSLSGCSVDDDAVMELCVAFQTNVTLSSLDLNENDISATGGVELAKALVPHPAMQELVLARNKIRDDGCCALAAMLEHNHVIENLNIEETWVSDRGAVALGVALANNTHVHSLNLQNNHISEEGGAALVALLERNHSILHCTLKGNSIYHNTVLHGSRIFERNRQEKADEKPRELRRKMDQLHYQVCKLSGATSEFNEAERRIRDIEQSLRDFETSEATEEEMFRKNKDKILEHIKQLETEASNHEISIKRAQEAFQKFVFDNDVLMKRDQAQLEQERLERKALDEALGKLQGEVAQAEAIRQEKISGLKKKIEDAKVDREHWIEQTKQYRQQSEQLAARLRELEEKYAADTSAKEIAAAEAKAAKSAKAATGKKTNKGADDIDALLNS